MSETARRTTTAEQSPCSGALEEAFSCYQAELLGMLYHLVGDIEDARDALQETFIKCWRHREKVAELDNLKAWIFRIALNTGRDVRQTAWRRRKKSLPEDETIIASHREGPESEVEQNEQIALIRDAVSRLRTEEKEVFLLRQNAQLTYEQIADTMGIPTGTVKTRMRLALIRLRESLAQTE